MEQLTLVTKVIATISKLTITETAQTGQVATVTLLVLCTPPPETTPTPPLDDEEPRLQAQLQKKYTKTYERYNLKSKVLR